MLCRAQDIDTAGASGAGRVALDVGIVCPQAASHLVAAAAEPLGAAEEYVRTKCARGDVETRVATQFWHRVGVDLVRANCRAFHRRLVGHGGDVLGAVGPLAAVGVLQVVEGL